MNEVFADTGYWIALLDPTDQYASSAELLSTQFSPASIVTSEMVLVEVLNYFGRYGPRFRKVAVDSVRAIIDDGVRVEPQTSDLFVAAVDEYARYDDKQWSLTDCSSMVIMKRLGIQQALTTDRHFEQMGFEALMRTG